MPALAGCGTVLSGKSGRSKGALPGKVCMTCPSYIQNARLRKLMTSRSRNITSVCSTSSRLDESSCVLDAEGPRFRVRGGLRICRGNSLATRNITRRLLPSKTGQTLKQHKPSQWNDKVKTAPMKGGDAKNVLYANFNVEYYSAWKMY